MSATCKICGKFHYGVQLENYVCKQCKWEYESLFCEPLILKPTFKTSYNAPVKPGRVK